MTNGTVVIAKGIVNQAGGQMTLSGNGNLIEDLGTSYFVNQGRVTQNCDPGTTNTIIFENLDNSRGSVSNLSGILVLQTFQTNLAGTYFAAAGATIQFKASNRDIIDGVDYNTVTKFVTPGPPLIAGRQRTISVRRW